ncbi:uncharacterized protein LOC143578849 [Bidens hawaiensis]|uniref:uncharacterized protein LOC143578849 n=1 Tax=Bidens hawaiensis TaxID=980011 RepID=UPI004049A526
MDAHPTPFPGNKSQQVKSKYKKISDAPKQMQRRTFGVIRDPNVPEKTLPRKPKAKPTNPIPPKQPKPVPESAPVPKPESTKKTVSKKKTVSFGEKIEGSGAKKSPIREGDGVKTPVKPPF